jgi:hypothetical protein
MKHTEPDDPEFCSECALAWVVFTGIVITLVLVLRRVLS